MQTPPIMAVKKRREFHFGVELTRLSKCENVIFLDVKATSAGCDGAPYSVIFLDTKTFPVRALVTQLLVVADVLGGERYPFRTVNLGHRGRKFN